MGPLCPSCLSFDVALPNSVKEGRNNTYQLHGATTLPEVARIRSRVTQTMPRNEESRFSLNPKLYYIVSFRLSGIVFDGGFGFAALGPQIPPKKFAVKGKR